MNVLRRLSRPALLSLAQGLETERMVSPISDVNLQPHVPAEQLPAIRDELHCLMADGMTGHRIAWVLRLLAEERSAAQAVADRVEIVWSGLDLDRSTTRDTGVVIAELFRKAQHSVLISTYAIDRGEKAESLFGELAGRLDTEADLEVQLFLNVQRKGLHDETPDVVLLREFADTFRDKIWPGERLPEVFYDPRSLDTGGKTRACLHAKCIVVDDKKALITSANFTEAAQARNIEAGVLFDDAALAWALRSQFDVLVRRKDLRRLPGLE